MAGSAERVIAAPRERVFEVAAAVERWAEWMSAVRSVAATPEGPLLIEARLLAIPLHLLARLEAEAPARLVVRRLPFEPGDAERFELELELASDGGRTRARAAVRAEVDVPRLLPLPRAVGDQVARRLLADLAGCVTS